MVIHGSPDKTIFTPTQIMIFPCSNLKFIIFTIRCMFDSKETDNIVGDNDYFLIHIKFATNFKAILKMNS